MAQNVEDRNRSRHSKIASKYGMFQEYPAPTFLFRAIEPARATQRKALYTGRPCTPEVEVGKVFVARGSRDSSQPSSAFFFCCCFKLCSCSSLLYFFRVFLNRNPIKFGSRLFQINHHKSNWPTSRALVKSVMGSSIYSWYISSDKKTLQEANSGGYQYVTLHVC